MKLNKEDLKNLKILTKINSGKKTVRIIFRKDMPFVVCYSTNGTRPLAQIQIPLSQAPDFDLGISDLDKFVSLVDKFNLDELDISLDKNEPNRFFSIKDRCNEITKLPLCDESLIFVIPNQNEEESQRYSSSSLLQRTLTGLPEIDYKQLESFVFPLSKFEYLKSTNNVISENPANDIETKQISFEFKGDKIVFQIDEYATEEELAKRNFGKNDSSMVKTLLEIVDSKDYLQKDERIFANIQVMNVLSHSAYRVYIHPQILIFRPIDEKTLEEIDFEYRLAYVKMKI